DSFQRQDFAEVAKFASALYDAKISKSSDSILIRLSKTLPGENSVVQIRKEYEIFSGAPRISVKYSLTLNESKGSLDAIFVPEINLGCLSDPVFTKSHERTISIFPASRIKYTKVGVEIILVSAATKNWMIPMKTVSLSEDGFESNLQGVSILPFYEIDLKRNESFKTVLDFEIRSIGS
ncbi:MAG: alpha-amylase/4-alpha-glucanotransferase domain-containing protein, partial [Nitrososphaerales archaeon]